MDAAVERALQTQGTSEDPIYRAGVTLLRERGARGRLVDVGCGVGRFREFAADLITDYVGVDVVRHPSLPAGATFHRVDLDPESITLAEESADVGTGIETIERLESPRSFVRELSRVLKPG